MTYKCPTSTVRMSSMLLSMLISFLLARRFGGKTYVLLITVPLVLVSFLSFGIIGSPSGTTLTPSYYPLPFSFPFYSIDTVHPSWHALQTVAETYEFWFLVFKIAVVWEWYPLAQLRPSPYGPITHSIFYNYLLINLVGAIFGYWISKTTFIERYVTRRKPEMKST